jgi:GAF domain-containing protein
MRRHDKTTGKTQRPKTLKRRNAPKVARRRSSLAASKEANAARLTRERDESLEQQAATADVLRVISRSTFNLQTVLDTLVQSAARLCEADIAAIGRPRDTIFYYEATYGFSPEITEFVANHPAQIDRGTISGRVLLERKIFHVPDVLADPEWTYAGRQKIVGRTMLGVPLLREGAPIGVISFVRNSVRPFTDRQIELATTFAAQAVIAIENTRLLNELRQRTDDLTESLEQQTATSEVLKVISSSPGELKPVFEAMLANATRICEAKFGILYLTEGDAFRTVALYGAPPAFAEARQREPLVRAGPGISLHQAAITRQPVQVADIQAEPAYTNDPQRFALLRLAGARTVLSVPMLKENEVLGVIVIYRQEVRPFTEKQIELVENFATQAVIAIDNARLLNELRESLQQQTATADVLKVISSSPGKLKPVFRAMLENAVHICGAGFGAMFRIENGEFEPVALHNVPEVLERHLTARGRIKPRPGSTMERVMRTKNVVHVSDLWQDADGPENPASKYGSARTYLGVPMLKDNKLAGAIVIFRQEVLPFSDKQIALVQNFAAQAVIAIENTRLLNELRQSLEQQTATADVLKVISSSPGDLEPVFQSMLVRAVQICEAKFGVLFRCYDDSEFHAAAWVDVAPEYEKSLRERQSFRPDADAPLGRLLLTKELVHTADELAEKSGSPAAKYGGARSLIAVPMRKQNELVGALVIYRTEVRPFTDKQIELVQNFAAQAVIAIENARLLDDLNKLNQQLEQRVTDQVGEIERMSKLRRFLPPQVADLIVASGTEKQLESHRREITALFCDLRGFTGFSESSDPEDVMALLHEYHSAIGGIINRYGGTLERYAGDGVMVVFNDPIPVDNPALQAVRMAIDMRAAIGELIEKWRKLGHDIGFGIGIAHGFATLGTIGFEGRFDYAAIGTVSNVASRLCDEAKPGQILISPRVLMAVEKDIAVEPVGDFALKGIRRPLAAYNVLATKAAN